MIDIHSYYSNPVVQAKLAYQCRFREVVIIKHLEEKNVTLRPLKIFKPEHFKWLYENRYHLHDTFFDIYISNASVKLPKLPHNTSKDTRDMISNIWNTIITGYDYFVDLDASKPEDEPEMIRWAKIIHDELLLQGHKDSYPVEIWTTGSGGVHIIHKGMFDPLFVKNNVMDIACKHGIPLRNPVKIVNGKRFIPVDKKWVDLDKEEKIPIIKKPFLDNSIYDIRRIRRVPCSIHSKTGMPMQKII
jgi:hypothetical protein